LEEAKPQETRCTCYVENGERISHGFTILDIAGTARLLRLRFFELQGSKYPPLAFPDSLDGDSRSIWIRHVSAIDSTDYQIVVSLPKGELALKYVHSASFDRLSLRYRH